MDSWPAPTLPQLPGQGPPLRIYDTASASVIPSAPGPTALLYVCGITPYDATHLGHAATYLAFDTMQRVWMDNGHDVHYVQNVTDIDDPLLERAAARGDDWIQLGHRETALYRVDMTVLGVLPPKEFVGAVESIPQIIELIERLREKGAAYPVDGPHGTDLYFSVSADPRFGGVGNYDAATMLALSAERGGDPDRPGKKDPLDCLLWQAARPGEPAWDSSLGRGRPGWHIECAAIALRHLGPTIDINGGGSDLVFPHHELSAAEAVVVTGAWPFAQAFVHQGMVGYQGEKMSKSRGNLVFVSRMRGEGVDPMAIRLALLAHEPGSDWEWYDDEIGLAQSRLARWREALRRRTTAAAQPAVDRLRAELVDGLRTPEALHVVDQWAGTDGDDRDAPAQMSAAVDALLGVV